MDSRSTIIVLLASILSVAACDNRDLSRVEVDGSSTVFPITEAVAEEFQKSNEAHVTIGVSGTGGGFKKFCRGETAVNDASRPIKPVEVKRCDKNGIDFIELPIAYDGVSVVVHPDNDWVETITVSELKQIWRPEAQNDVDSWSQIRDDWPDKPISLFGPGTDSGTYDYFSEAIVGEQGATRGDFTSSEDDNVLVKGVSTDPQALGFFGFAYYRENRKKLRALEIKNGASAEPVAPSRDTISNGDYQPLTRPLFIYINEDAADRSEVERFVEFYLDESAPLIEDVGYVPLPERVYEMAQKRFDNATTGSMFGGEGAKVGVSVEDLLKKNRR